MHFLKTKISTALIATAVLSFSGCATNTTSNYVVPETPNWTMITEYENDVMNIYYAPNHITPSEEGAHIKNAILLLQPTEDMIQDANAASSITFVSINCSNKAMRVNQALLYNQPGGKGPIKTANKGDGRFAPPVRSENDNLVKAICK